MSFIERFKGRTSIVGKEGIQSVLLSTSESSQISKESFKGLQAQDRQFENNDSKIITLNQSIRKNKQDRENEMRRNVSNIFQLKSSNQSFKQQNDLNQQQQGYQMAQTGDEEGKKRQAQNYSRLLLAQQSDQIDSPQQDQSLQLQKSSQRHQNRFNVPTAILSKEFQRSQSEKQTPSQSQLSLRNFELNEEPLQKKQVLGGNGQLQQKYPSMSNLERVLSSQVSQPFAQKANSVTIAPPSFYSQNQTTPKYDLQQMDWTPKVKASVNGFSLRDSGNNSFQQQIKNLQPHSVGSIEQANNTIWSRLSEQQQQDISEIRSKKDFYNGNWKYDVVNSPKVGDYNALGGKRGNASGGATPTLSFASYSFDQRKSSSQLLLDKQNRETPGGFRFRDLDENYSALHRGAKIILQKDQSQQIIQQQQQ